MLEVPQKKLLELVTKRQAEILSSPQQFDNLLNDVLRGHYRRERKALSDALRESVVSDLRAPRYLPAEALIDILAKRLHDHVGTDINLARWAVTAWELALTSMQSRTKPPSRAMRWVKLGERRFQAGELEHAAEAFETVIRLEDVPSDLKYRAIVNLGVVHFTKGMTEKGLNRFSPVINDIDATSLWRVNALINRGMAQCRLQQLPSGIADFTDALTKFNALPSQEAIALARRGVAFSKQQQFELAIPKNGPCRRG